MECESLEQYLKAFDVSLSVMQQPDAIRRIVVEACTDAVDDGVRYLELRFAPMLHTDGGLQLAEVMDAVLEGKLHAELTLNITVGVIICGIRHFDPAVVEQQASLAWRYRERGGAKPKPLLYIAFNKALVCEIEAKREPGLVAHEDLRLRHRKRTTQNHQH